MFRTVIALTTMLFATTLFADDAPVVAPKPDAAKPAAEPKLDKDNPVFVSKLPEDSSKVAEYLQDISVTIVTNRGEGSGVIKTKFDANGNKVNFVWTAAHVIESLRTTRTIVDPKTGTERTLVEFGDAFVVKDIKQEGRSVGQLKLQAEVIRYSDADNGEDLALLRIRKSNFIDSSASFWNKKEIPTIGTPLYHVGSLLGQMGSNSMTTGIVSQHGRLIFGNKRVFDQTTVAAFPGSSGGGVYAQDGSYIGMLVRGAGETFNLIVPVRRMREWGQKANIMWAITDDPMPSEDELLALPIEDTGKIWNADLAKARREGGSYDAETGVWKDAKGNVTSRDFFRRYSASYNPNPFAGYDNPNSQVKDAKTEDNPLKKLFSGLSK